MTAVKSRNTFCKRVLTASARAFVLVTPCCTIIGGFSHEAESSLSSYSRSCDSGKKKHDPVFLFLGAFISWVSCVFLQAYPNPSKNDFRRNSLESARNESAKDVRSGLKPHGVFSSQTPRNGSCAHTGKRQIKVHICAHILEDHLHTARFCGSFEIFWERRRLQQDYLSFPDFQMFPDKSRSE